MVVGAPKTHILFAAHVRRSNLSSESVQLFPYDTAIAIAQLIRTLIHPHAERVMICGGLRREREQVHDIDIVCQDRDRFAMITALAQVMDSMNPTIHKLTFVHSGIPGEIFFVKDEQQFEVVKLIRTGDAQFIKSLAISAIDKGYTLRSKIDEGYYKIPMYGLYKIGGTYYTGLFPNKQKHYYCNDMIHPVAWREKDILWLIHGKYIEPRERSWYSGPGQDQDVLQSE